MLASVLHVLRRYPRFGAIGGMLLLALGVTAGAQWRALHTAPADLDARRTAAIEQVLRTIETDFNALHARLRGRADALARDTVVLQTVREASAESERPIQLFQRIRALRIDAHSSVDVYDHRLRLLAWDGRRLPRTAPPSPTQQRAYTTIAQDSEILDALAVWAPLRLHDTLLGWVRITRSVRYEPPVRNRYIRSFSLAETWSQHTDTPVTVRWGMNEAAPPNRPSRLLRGDAKTVLGVASIDPPSPARMIQEMEQQYDDLLAFWVTLLLAWAVGGLWYGYWRSMQSASTAPRLPLRTTVWFGTAAAAWVGTRFMLLPLDVPKRWVPDDSWLAPLFDPTHLASTIGGGIMRSTGDLLMTSLFAAGLAVALLHVAAPLRLRVGSLSDLADHVEQTAPGRPSALRFVAVLIGMIGSGLAAVVALAHVVRRAVLDSTLDFFSRSGLLPEPLVLVVLCALFLLVLAALLGTVALLWVGLRLLLRYRPVHWPRGTPTLSVTAVIVLSIAGVYALPAVNNTVPFIAVAIFLGTVSTAAFFGLDWPHGGIGQLTLRGLLPSVLALTILLYPMLYVGIDTQRREHMADAAQSFEDGRDPRVLFAIEHILRITRTLFDRTDASLTTLSPDRIDSLTTRAVRSSLLASLTAYEASVAFGTGDQIRHRYTTAGLQTRRSPPAEADRVVVSILRMLMDARNTSSMVEQLHDRQQLRRSTEERFQYAGMAPLSDATADGTWMMLRVEPRSLLPGTGTRIPRVLLPDGSFSDLYADLSLAEFRNGVLVRSLGHDFGRTQIDPRLRTQVSDGTPHWIHETIRGRPFFTYYHQLSRPDAVIAVRIPAVLAFDHLYHLLRLTVAGLCVALFIYLLGVYGRYRRGLLPATRVRFRDKVLNAFLLVGVVSMIAVGVVGVQVVTGENSRVTERRLRDQLSRVEETLALEARPDEPLYQVATRLSVDSLAARVGLDLRLYNDTRLVATSRPRLVRDRLVDQRLSAEVYHALFNEAYRFTVAQARVGQFPYQVGYQALADDTGQPRLVVAIPTLAQQERIEEEQARTLAYLFGALLLLVVVVMLTALLLSNALAQPIAQLREGLEAVGEGRFARVLPVDTRDEIGDLVRTFNDMREQLAESRRKLAKQERELAWREMARQVAHEIKNPLTPMKLSIQHMRRAFHRDGGDDRFPALFDRITATLIEQIEALARIANEFSSFARLPTRVLEPLDLNDVIREAVRLMQEEAALTVHLDLHDAPLVVEADREELRRTYINLLKNALQAIPDERDGEIHVSTQRVSSQGDAVPAAHSAIRDNGTGIPPDVQDKIFQPNFSTKTSGTGLGLAIAKKSIEELDGRIDFETTDGQGTTFRIWLPLAEEATVAA